MNSTDSTADKALFVFTSDNKLVMLKDPKTGNPKLWTTKYFRNAPAEWSKRFGAPLTEADDMAIIPVHNVNVQFMRTSANINHADLLVYDSVDAMKESVTYENFGSPLKSKGWQAAAYSFTGAGEETKRE